MTLRTLLLRSLLALALVAYGLPVAAAVHAHGPEAAQAVDDAASPPCHGQDSPPPPAESSDCCDGDGPACGCECLHATPALAAAARQPGSLPAAAARQAPTHLPSPRDGPLPSLRPPIA